MKTTVDISDPLLEEAKKAASDDRTTLKALVELGLRRVLSEREKDRTYRLRKATFKGEGLQPELVGATWEDIRELIYKGHGT